MKIDPQKTLTAVLLGFVLVSIGFALGRETAGRAGGPAEAAAPASRPADGDRVLVYYLHATFRCVTCNRIEQLAESVVRSGFAAQLADGRLEWRTADYQQDPALAERYGVGAACVVVVRLRGGQEDGFQRLDEVWTKIDDPAEFNRYVGGAIRRMLDGGGA